MSRKRALKKQQKRLGTVLERLEELDRRGADEEYLALAAAQPEGAAGGALTARRGDVADRALRRALAAADFERVERLLRALGPADRRRPPALLAAAAAEIAAGRLAAARARLDELAAAGGPAALEGTVDPALLPALRVLAGGDGPAPRSAPPELADLARLRALAGREPGAGPAEAGAPAGRPRLSDPLLRAAQDFLLALRDLEAAGCVASAGHLRTLRRLAGRLTKAAPAGDRDFARLLDAAWSRLDLFGALDAVEDRVSRPRRGESASRALLEALRRPGGALSTALAEPAPPPLAPLAHALRLRWRAVLAAVAERESAEGLAALAAARPELVERELDLPAAAGPGAAGLQQARRARALLAGGRFEELTGVLRARVRGESEPSDLAALWALELWAGRQMAGSADDDDPADGSEPPAHRAMVRIEEMAAEIGRRFPAEQRGGVARALRDELLAVCEAISLCEHTGGAAVALLDHLPGDAGLLIAGLGGAIAGGDRRCRRALEARLAARGGTVRDADRAVALRMMAQAAVELPDHLAATLATVRPLFSDRDWVEAAELVARKTAPMFGAFLRESSSLAWLHPGIAEEGAAAARHDLERLRPALGATPGFAAIELVLDCWRPEHPAAVKKARALLAAAPGYETALIAIETFRAALGEEAPAGAVAALDQLAGGMIDRLDDRWQRWWRAVPVLAAHASRSGLRSLERRIERLLDAPGLDDRSRRLLEAALDAALRAERLKRAFPAFGPEASRRRRGRRPTRDRSDRPGPAPGPAAGPGRGPAAGPARGPGGGPATGPAASPGRGPATGPGSGSGRDTAAGPAAGHARRKPRRQPLDDLQLELDLG